MNPVGFQAVKIENVPKTIRYTPTEGKYEIVFPYQKTLSIPDIMSFPIHPSSNPQSRHPHPKVHFSRPSGWNMLLQIQGGVTTRIDNTTERTIYTFPVTHQGSLGQTYHVRIDREVPVSLLHEVWKNTLEGLFKKNNPWLANGQMEYPMVHHLVKEATP